MQSATTTQPARISNYNHESERFQDSDWPILQNVMASINASGKAYNAWSPEAIGRLLDAYHSPDGQTLEYLVIDRIRSKIQSVCRIINAFPPDRDAELEFIYQIYATGSQEMENLPSMPKWKKSDPRNEAKIHVLRTFVRSRSSPVEQRGPIATRSQMRASRTAATTVQPAQQAHQPQQSGGYSLQNAHQQQSHT
jgi:hypothetical protein